MSEPTKNELAMVPDDVLAASKRVDHLAGRYTAAFEPVPEIADDMARRNAGLSSAGGLAGLCNAVLGAVTEVAGELQTHSGMLERLAKEMRRTDEERRDATVANTLGDWPGQRGRE